MTNPEKPQEGVVGQPKQKSTEAIANTEKFTNLQSAIGDYSEEKIKFLSGIILGRFKEGKLDILDPGASTDPGITYRNLIFGLAFGAVEIPRGYDDLNFTMFGMAIKRVMDGNPEFDSYIRGFIKTAEQDAADAWNGREELYNRYLQSDHDGHPRTYLLDPNNARYNQGKVMAKFILGEI